MQNVAEHQVSYSSAILPQANLSRITLNGSLVVTVQDLCLPQFIKSTPAREITRARTDWWQPMSSRGWITRINSTYSAVFPPSSAAMCRAGPITITDPRICRLSAAETIR